MHILIAMWKVVSTSRVPLILPTFSPPNHPIRIDFVVIPLNDGSRTEIILWWFFLEMRFGAVPVVASSGPCKRNNTSMRS